jgi:hypothetical protein
MHAMYSVRKLGTACADCTPTTISRPPWPSPRDRLWLCGNASEAGPGERYKVLVRSSWSFVLLAAAAAQHLTQAFRGGYDRRSMQPAGLSRESFDWPRDADRSNDFARG